MISHFLLLSKLHQRLLKFLRRRKTRCIGPRMQETEPHTFEQSMSLFRIFHLQKLLNDAVIIGRSQKAVNRSRHTTNQSTEGTEQKTTRDGTAAANEALSETAFGGLPHGGRCLEELHQGLIVIRLVVHKTVHVGNGIVVIAKVIHGYGGSLWLSYNSPAQLILTKSVSPISLKHGSGDQCKCREPRTIAVDYRYDSFISGLLLDVLSAQLGLRYRTGEV
jgi:hypothetical protein